MSTTQTSAGRDGRGSVSRPAEHDDWMLAEITRQRAAGIPNLDNLGAGVDWDGDRCGECRAPVPDGARLCEDCEEDQ